MEELLFWNKWNKGEKTIFFFLIGLFITSFVAFIVFKSIGIFNILDWDTYVDVNNISITFDQFSRYMLDFNIDTENFLVSQYYLPTSYNTNATYGIVYFCVLAFMASTALAAISMLKKIYWFSGLATVFIIWLTFLHLDTIGFLGDYNKIYFIGLIALFIGTAFYFHAFAENVSFIIRLVILTLIMAVFLYTTNSFSDVNNSLFLLSSNSYFVAIGLSILFIGIVSYDIITAIVFLNGKTRNFNPKSNITNLAGLSALYLISPVLMYLKDINAISFNIGYFNVYYLLFVSTIIGLWAQKRRSIILKGNLPYQPVGAILMLCLAVITFASIAYAHATFNMSVVEMFESIILYSHVAFGFSFIMYVIFNFSPLLLKNIDITNHIFSPLDNIPYYTVRLAGSVILLVMLNIKNFAVVNQFIAGYNNYKGDVAYYLGDDLMAEYFYEVGAKKDIYNTKSNYPLSEINIKRKKYQAAKKNVENCVYDTPHPLTYSANQYVYELNNDAFYNIWKLEEAIKMFPESYHLRNNLAITYAKENIKAEACLTLYDEALQLSDNNPAIKSNLVAFCAKNNLINEADEILEKLPTVGLETALETNKLAVWNLLQKPSTSPDVAKNITNRNLYNTTSSFIYNATFRKLPCNEDLIQKTDEVLQNENNAFYANDLQYLKAIQTFYSGKHDEAKKQFDQILIDCPTSLYPYYSNIFALLMLKIEADDIAHEYFRKSHESQQFRKINKAPLYYAFSASKRVSTDSLSKLFNYIADFDTSYYSYAKQFASTLKLKDLSSLQKLEDFEKVQYIELQNAPLNEAIAIPLVNSINDDDLKVLAATLMMEKHLVNKNTEKAGLYYSLIPAKINNKFAVSKMNIQFLNMLYHSKMIDQLLENSKTLNIVQEDQAALKILLTKVAIDQRKLDVAEKLIQEYTALAPLNTEGIILKAAFVSTYKKDINKGYEILLGATKTNPTSLILKQAYALQCLDMNMDLFAETTRDELEYQMLKQDYSAFLKEFATRKQLAEIRFNNW